MKTGMIATAWGFGLLFLNTLAAASEPGLARSVEPEVRLAVELMEERNWAAAQRESQRVLLADPTHHSARLIGLIAQVRLGQNPRIAMREIEDLITQDDTLSLLLERDSRGDRKMRDECSLPRPAHRRSLLALPGEIIVAFYRFCISPAIGARCSIQPSCSQYFLEASRKHGLLAFPIIADRLVREPGLVAEKRVTVLVGGKTRIADPLADHDNWLSTPSRTRACQP